MKLTKILALILACCMIVCTLVACGGDGNNTGGDTSDDASGGDEADVTLTVSIKVYDADNKVVYENESYTYKGKAPTVIELIDDYLLIEGGDATLDYDENGNLSSIGIVEAGVVTSHNSETNEDVELYTTYWWYRLNGKEGSDAMEEYIVQNGDAIEYILLQAKSSN
ncbi:MAG: hypothetical protein IJY27_04275 [Clostridia bacterium]|nr:hypothetical protein [Clostridia bacterium]